MRCSKFFGLGFALLSFMVNPIIAQNPLASMPKCAATCFQSALMNQTTCQPTDLPCICGSAPLNAAIQGCVLGTCTVKEGLVAVNTTTHMCGREIRDRTQVLFITSVVAGSIALLAVAVRMSVAYIQRSFGLDDIFCLAAEAACLPITLMQCYTPFLGFGKDTWLVSPDNIYSILKLVYASQISYFPCSGFTKLCFLFFFLRIFPTKSTQKLIYVFVGISMAYTAGFGITMIFACKPISATWTSWDMEHKPDYCINQNVFYLVAAGFNIAIDLAIVAIPIPELLKLKLSLRKKIFLCAIFSVGGMTIVVSCIRLSALAVYATSANPIYDNMMSGVYSVLEVNVGIICICMPAFRRFMAHLMPHCFGSTQNDSKYNRYDDGTPNAKISSGKRSGRKKSTLDGSLFNTTIMKTVDTRVEAVSKEDDEVRLVELQKNGKSAAGSTNGSTEGPDNLQLRPDQSFYHGQ